MTTMAAGLAKMFVRLPSDTHQALVEWAREDGRSLNGQIVWLLRRALAERQRSA